jgi:predicted Zn-dependent protease
LLCDAFVRVGRHHEALAMTYEGLERFPNDPVLATRRAFLLVESGRLGEAEQCLVQLIRSPVNQPHLSGDQAVLDRREARALLGRVYHEQGRFLDAERIFQELLAAHPTYVEGWVGLSYVYLLRQRFGESEYVARQLEKCAHGAVYAATLRAEIHILKGELAPARTLLDQAMALAPNMAWPRIVLGDWLMRSDADLSACIAAQRDVLRLDPGNYAATQHLERLLALQGGSPAPQSPWFSFDV